MFTADLLERAVKTFVQTFVAVFLAALVVPASVVNWSDWKATGIAAATAGLTAALSALTSIISKPVGNTDSASLVKGQ